MIPKVPTLEDQDVSKLIEAVGIDAQPIYVAVKPDSRALINECFPNVAEKIKNEGGHQVIGWQVWKTQNLIEAEFHAV